MTWNQTKLNFTDHSTDVICKCCGAKSVVYTYSFNLGLSILLAKLFKADGPVSTDDLGLTYSQRTNSQKLRYWGLAEPHLVDETRQKRGWWVITEKGKAFVRGEITIPQKAKIRRNVVLELTGEDILFDDVCQGYLYHQDYADMVVEQLEEVSA
jgi:hypothetical protein